jgi:hypothetical protein
LVPTAITKQKLDQWLQTVSLSISEDRRADLLAYLDEVSGAFDALAEDLKPDLQDLSCKWGLPLKLAQKINDQGALKVIAVASFLAA